MRNTIPHKVDARYDDCTSGQVNLEMYPHKSDAFAPLIDLNNFEKFFIDLNALCWPNGADIAPKRIYEKM
jgi:hypothetical protein